MAQADLHREDNNIIIQLEQESTADECDDESSENEVEEPPLKKTPGKYKVSVLFGIYDIT